MLLETLSHLLVDKKSFRFLELDRNLHKRICKVCSGMLVAELDGDAEEEEESEDEGQSDSQA